MTNVEENKIVKIVFIKYCILNTLLLVHHSKSEFQIEIKGTDPFDLLCTSAYWSRSICRSKILLEVKFRPR